MTQPEQLPFEASMRGGLVIYIRRLRTFLVVAAISAGVCALLVTPAIPPSVKFDVWGWHASLLQFVFISSVCLLLITRALLALERLFEGDSIPSTESAARGQGRILTPLAAILMKLAEWMYILGWLIRFSWSIKVRRYKLRLAACAILLCAAPAFLNVQPGYDKARVYFIVLDSFLGLLSRPAIQFLAIGCLLGVIVQYHKDQRNFEKQDEVIRVIPLLFNEFSARSPYKPDEAGNAIVHILSTLAAAANRNHSRNLVSCTLFKKNSGTDTYSPILQVPSDSRVSNQSPRFGHRQGRSQTGSGPLIYVPSVKYLHGVQFANRGESTTVDLVEYAASQSELGSFHRAQALAWTHISVQQQSELEDYVLLMSASRRDSLRLFDLRVLQFFGSVISTLLSSSSRLSEIEVDSEILMSDARTKFSQKLRESPVMSLSFLPHILKNVWRDAVPAA